jgi:GDP-L-fucose synthase
VEKNSLIYVAGHRGLVGSAICRNLRKHGFERLLLRTRAELDLTDAVAVRSFFEQERPCQRSLSRRLHS